MRRKLNNKIVKKVAKGVSVSVYQELVVKDILIDHEVYQRMIDEKQVKELENNWEDCFSGTGEVSLRSDGKYYAIDCQHRLEAMKRLGIEYTTFRVHDNRHLTISQAKEWEANCFIKLNGCRKKLRNIDMIRASAATKEGEDYEICQLINKHRFEMNRGAKDTRRWGKNGFTGLSKKAYKKGFLEHLLRFAKAFQEENGNNWIDSFWGQEKMMKTLFFVIQKNDLSLPDCDKIGKDLAKDEDGILDKLHLEEMKTTNLGSAIPAWMRFAEKWESIYPAFKTPSMLKSK